MLPTVKYGWTIKGGVFDGSKTIQGSNNADTLNTNTTKTTLHGLDGNDTLDTPVPSWSIVNLVPVPSAAAVTKSLRLEVALYPINKSLTGGATDDILIGGAGDDTLTGAGGRDIFDYGFKNAGNDIINDFTVGNIGMLGKALSCHSQLIQPTMYWCRQYFPK
jgi:Ca2+-binding RTX toxin-like protein